MSYAAGDVVLVDLGTTPPGREQAGVRPAIFVSAESGVSLLIPLSSNAARLQFKGTVRIEPDGKNKLVKPSVALVFQLRAVDSRRLLHKIGVLGVKDKQAINRVLRSVALIK